MNESTGAPKIGDWVGGPAECCGPCAGVSYCWVTRASDFCLSHFALFAQVRSSTYLTLTEAPNLVTCCTGCGGTLVMAQSTAGLPAGFER